MSEVATLEAPVTNGHSINGGARRKQISYDIASCARCGSKIAKGETVELWSDGPRYGSKLRWVHVGCEQVVASQPAPAAQVSDEQVREILAEMVGKLDLTSAADHLKGEFNKSLLEYGQQMGAATSEACGLLAEAVQGELNKTLLRVEELVQSGIKHVHEIKKWNGESVVIEEHVHPAFTEVLELAAAREEVFLPGPAGCGKSHLARQVAKALGLEFKFISCSAGMSEGQLLGKLLPTGEAGKFEYSRSDFVKCYEEGGVFLLDEIDAADSNTLLVLNAALANGEMAVPNRIENPVAKRHPDFICIAAANTFGRGSDRLYVGRAQLDESTLDRFRLGVVEMDYDTELEQKLCPCVELRDMAWKIRESAARNKLTRVISTRFLVKSYKMMVAAGWSIDKCRSKLLAGWTADEVRKVS